MLEVIREHAQGKIAKVILVLITIPFALWGVDSYLQNDGDGPIAAKVGGQEISQKEFTEALKDQQERMRSALGKSYDAAVMDRPETRKSVLDRLINQRLILADAAQEGLAISDAQLVRFIAGIEAFQENGKFSQSRYESLLRQQNMSPAMFEHRLRQDLLSQTAQDGMVRSASLPRSVADRLMRINEQEREVSQAVIPIEQFMPQSKVEAPAVKDYYDKHQSEFKVPEQARLEYVVLSAENLVAQVTVSEEEIAAYYKEHASQFGQAEERQASHILITVAANASAAEKAVAEDKARKLGQEARQNPANFAQLAKQHSQDTGSASQGGDLGLFARGAMVKPFEDAVFKMAPGEISEPVLSDFGYHIIKLATVKPAKIRVQQEVRSEITQALKKQKAGKKFTESAENFSNMVYEQGDSLRPAAQQLGLQVEQSAWVSRMASDTPLLNNPKLLQAVFSDDVLKDKRNSEAVEVAPNVLVSARLLEYKPASVKPLEDVADVLSQRLQRQQAAVLAVKLGKDAMAQLQQGKTPAALNWSAAQVVSRIKPAGLESAALKEVFKLKGDKLPGYAGLENAQGGFTLVKVTRVIEPGALDESRKQAYAQRFSNMLEQEYAAAYLTSLKSKAKIDIKRESLEKTER
ncbi:MAG: SurA N-terminal domain-containing protein [Sulfurimicrobium sp.]|nr:SurA N-terminal domain-containing protein [Sulfurimicrobium sp.]